MFVSDLKSNGVEPLLRHSVTLIMVIWASVEMAHLTWTVIDEETAIVVAGINHTETAKKGANRADYNLQDLAKYNLFGQVRDKEITSKPVQQKVINAPQTKLNLTLRGVFAADRGAFALIAIGKETEQVYSVGKKINPTTTIEAIHADSVVLNRNGGLEVLYLSDTGTKQSTDNGSGRQKNRGSSRFKGGKRASASSPTKYGKQRERLLKDPQAAMKLAKIQPVMKRGKLAGYRLNPGNDPKLFSDLGFKAGDLVKEINGIAVSDAAKMGDLLKQLTSAGELNVTIERKGRLESLSIIF